VGGIDDGQCRLWVIFPAKKAIKEIFWKGPHSDSKSSPPDEAQKSNEVSGICAALTKTS
jgi:hypothetical protein